MEPTCKSGVHLKCPMYICLAVLAHSNLVHKHWFAISLSVRINENRLWELTNQIVQAILQYNYVVCNI